MSWAEIFAILLCRHNFTELFSSVVLQYSASLMYNKMCLCMCYCMSYEERRYVSPVYSLTMLLLTQTVD